MEKERQARHILRGVKAVPAARGTEYTTIPAAGLPPVTNREQFGAHHRVMKHPVAGLPQFMRPGHK